MIKIDCAPSSPEWYKARAGYPTASQFHRILTPAKLEPSAQAFPYLCDLVAERLLGVSLEPEDKWKSDWIERGKDMEQAAADWYAFHTDTDPEEGGFCMRDDRLAGCSPDRLIGDDGGLEIKCPGAGQHISYLLGKTLPKEYRLQVQGSLWVTGRAWWDFVSFNPSLPRFLVRVTPDPEVFDALDKVMPTFNQRLAQAEASLREETK